MAKILYFGEIDPENPQKDYRSETVVNGQKVHLDLNFFGERPKDGWGAWPEAVNKMLDLTEKFETEAREFLTRDFTEEGETLEYAKFHLDELDDLTADLEEIMKGADASKSKYERLIDSLRLLRIGFYPGHETFAVWDFHIAVELTDQLLVVKFDEKGKPLYISWES